MKKILLKIEGMTCSACSNGLEKYLNKQDGIINASVNLVMANALIEYDETKLNQKQMELAKKYRISTDKINYLIDRYGTIEDAINGATDIIAENISDVAEYRKRIKSMCYREGFIKTKATNEEEKSSYEMYYDFSEGINRIPSHRILAINRGEKEKFLKVKLEKPDEKIIEYI